MEEEQQAGQESAQAIAQSAKSVGSAAANAGKSAVNAGKKAVDAGKKIADVGKKLAKTLKPMLKAFLQYLKAAGKTILAFLKWLIGIIIAYWWVFLIIAAVAIVLVCAISVVMWVLGAGWDENRCTVSSIGGVTGDSFYGTRFLYYDDIYTSNDLANTYLEFTYNILQEVNKINTISIDFSTSYETNSQVNAIAVSFASALSGQSGAILNAHTSVIDHYGFTDSEDDIVLENIANYVVTKGYTANNYESMLTLLKNAYDTELAYMKNVCKKIIIKDYILEDGEYTSDIEREDYFGFVYMPKQTVTLTKTSFIFVVDEGKQVKTKVMYSSGSEQTVLEEETADSTWFVDGMTEKSLDVTDSSNYTLNQFTAIDTSDLTYLANGKTLFQILRDEKFGVYFKNIDASDLNKNKTEAQEGTNEILLKNINTENCMYILMDADAPFNIAESFVNVKKH